MFPSGTCLDAVLVLLTDRGAHWGSIMRFWAQSGSLSALPRPQASFRILKRKNHNYNGWIVFIRSDGARLCIHGDLIKPGGGSKWINQKSGQTWWDVKTSVLFPYFIFEHNLWPMFYRRSKLIKRFSLFGAKNAILITHPNVPQI